MPPPAKHVILEFLEEVPDLFDNLRAALDSVPDDASSELQDHAKQTRSALATVYAENKLAFEVSGIDDSFLTDLLGNVVHGAGTAGYAFCEILGPDGAYYHESSRLGISYQAPGLAYRAHHHVAQELYFVLRGSSLWWTDSVPQWEERKCSFHRNSEHHAMRTEDEPALYFWSWTGDIGMDVKHSSADIQAKL
jgi:hypothetical protein